MFDFVQTGVAALRSGRNKGNVSYANDEEGFGGAALSNTTLASEDEEEEDEFDNDEEDEDDEDEDEEEEEDSESEGEEDGDDEEEDSESENKRAKKKQRFAAPNGENNKKRKRALLARIGEETKTMKEEIESAVEKINDNTTGSREREEESDRVQLYSRKRCLRRVGCAPGGGGGRNKEHDSRHN